MKYSSILFGSLLCLTFSTAAQTNFAQVSLAAPAFGVTPAVAAGSPAAAGMVSALPAPESTFGAPFASLSPADPAAFSPAEPPPQGVQGVFEKYSYDAYIGYTFFRFY